MSDWEESETTSSPSFEDGGRNFGKGRGFTPSNTSSVGGSHSNNDDQGGFRPRSYNNGDGDDRGRRGGGRGGGRGGFRNRDDNNDDGGDGGGFKPRDNYDGNRRGRGGGGYRNRDDNNDDGGDSGGFKPRDNYDGNRRGRGGGGFRNRDDEDGGDSGGFKPRDNYDGNRRGRGGGGFRNRDDNNDDGGDGGGFKSRDNFDGSRRGRGGGGFRNRDDNNGEGGDDGFKKRDNFNDGENGEGGEEEKKKPPVNYIPPELDTDESALYSDGTKAGINFNKYESIEVKVTGENIPTPINSFEESGLRSLILENVKKSGYLTPTPIQKHSIPIIMNGRDLMACAQTGSGKTAAFAVPIIHTLLENPRENPESSGCEPRAIVLSPTRELAIQIHSQFMKFAMHSILKCDLAYGGTSVNYQSGRLNRGCDILVATTGRLVDFVNRRKVSLASLQILVLDEADRMLDMGFVKDIDILIDHETMSPAGERQTLMFSATFQSEVQHLALRFLKNYIFAAIGIVGGACEDVTQEFYEVPKHKKRDMLMEILDKEYNQQGGDKKRRTLIFINEKKGTDFLASYLSDNDFPTTSIHGDREQKEREEAVRDFKSGKRPILVGTDVASRGLDIPNISHVINFDLPKEVDVYVHRIGRTGRVGNTGKATSFFDPRFDQNVATDLVRILRQAKQPVPDFMESGGGGGSYGPGRSNNQFGGEDIRSFNKGESYPDSAYAPAIEPEENW